MIRVVLTVLVAVALLAATTPALEDARRSTTVERLDAEADRVERAVGDLVAGSVSVDDPALAAQTTVTVRAPSGFDAAQVERLVLVETAEGVAIRYRIDGRPERTIPIAPGGVAAAVAISGDETGGDRIVLRPGGESRLVLRLVDDGGPTVRIARIG